jgi:sporulation protein YpjB
LYKRSLCLWMVALHLLCWGLVGSPTVYAHEAFQQEGESWSQLVDEIVQLVEEEKWLEARELLAVLAYQFSQSKLSEQKLTVESIHELSGLILEMEHNLNQISPNLHQIRVSMQRLQLAFDAISHLYQPLWKQYYHPMKEHIALLEQVIQAQKEEKVQEVLAQIQQDYQMIRPALIVSKSPATVQKVDSLLTFTSEQKDLKQFQTAANQLKELLPPLFFGSEKDIIVVGELFLYHSVQLVILWVSGMIALVLAYVSWRKYRAMQQAVA